MRPARSHQKRLAFHSTSLVNSSNLLRSSVVQVSIIVKDDIPPRAGTFYTICGAVARYAFSFSSDTRSKTTSLFGAVRHSLFICFAIDICICEATHPIDSLHFRFRSSGAFALIRIPKNFPLHNMNQLDINLESICQALHLEKNPK